jgi:hypothetical protein
MAMPPIASDLSEDFIYTVLYIINMHVCIKTNGFKISNIRSEEQEEKKSIEKGKIRKD